MLSRLNPQSTIIGLAHPTISRIMKYILMYYCCFDNVNNVFSVGCTKWLYLSAYPNDILSEKMLKTYTENYMGTYMS